LGTPLLSLGISDLIEKTFSVNLTFHPFKILILDGTSFLGPHQLAYAFSSSVIKII
jgi:hypothetical protein